MPTATAQNTTMMAAIIHIGIGPYSWRTTSRFS
jgi:hypothetical protein